MPMTLTYYIGCDLCFDKQSTYTTYDWGHLWLVFKWGMNSAWLTEVWLVFKKGMISV